MYKYNVRNDITYEMKKCNTLFLHMWGKLLGSTCVALQSCGLARPCQNAGESSRPGEWARRRGEYPPPRSDLTGLRPFSVKHSLCHVAANLTESGVLRFKDRFTMQTHGRTPT